MYLNVATTCVTLIFDLSNANKSSLLVIVEWPTPPVGIQCCNNNWRAVVRRLIRIRHHTSLYSKRQEFPIYWTIYMWRDRVHVDKKPLISGENCTMRGSKIPGMKWSRLRRTGSNVRYPSRMCYSITPHFWERDRISSEFTHEREGDSLQCFSHR